MSSNKFTQALVLVLKNPDKIKALKMLESEQSISNPIAFQTVIFEYEKILFAVGWRSSFDLDTETNHVQHEFRILKPGTEAEDYSTKDSVGLSVSEQYSSETDKTSDNPGVVKLITDLFEIAKSKQLGIDSLLDKLLPSYDE